MVAELIPAEIIAVTQDRDRVMGLTEEDRRSYGRQNDEFASMVLTRLFEKALAGDVEAIKWLEGRGLLKFRTWAIPYPVVATN